MTERVHIPKGEGPFPTAGEWVFETDSRQPWHRCPKCKRGSLMTNHSVDPDGTVNASIACFPPCDYHIWGILDGWAYGKKEAGKPVPP